MASDFKHGELTEWIIGIFYDVYNELGHGFLESVYEKAMLIALRDAGIAVQYKHPIEVLFRGHVVGTFEADLLVEGVVTLELKSARAIDPAYEAQLLNNLRATSIEVGLVLKFRPQAGVPPPRLRQRPQTAAGSPSAKTGRRLISPQMKFATDERGRKQIGWEALNTGMMPGLPGKGPRIALDASGGTSPDCSGFAVWRDACRAIGHGLLAT